MRRAELQRVGQLLCPSVRALTGPRIDEVDRVIVENGLNAFECFERSAGIMIASQKVEGFIV